MLPKLKIRKAVATDVQLIYELMMEIAHPGQEAFVLTNESELLDAAFSHRPKFSVILAEYNQQIAGYLSYTINYSIWQGAAFINVDDLFVREPFRNKNIGKSLMEELKNICLANNIRRLKWEVESNNLGAIKFYESLGAKISHKGIFNWVPLKEEIE